MSAPKKLLWLLCMSIICIWYTSAADAMELNQKETVFNEYTMKSAQIVQYNWLLELLKSEWLDENATLDSALLMIVQNKIDTLESEYSEYIEKIKSMPLDELFNYYLPEVEYNLVNIDMSAVKEAWLNKVNWVRSVLWLKNYRYNKVLDHSAQVRAEELALKYGSSQWVWWMATHQRDNQPTAWYNHKTMWKWFAKHGIYTVATNGSNYTENTWYGMYSCKKDDCTKSMISAIMSTFEFYMREKSYGGPHYRSLINPNFTTIWLWLACVNSSNGWSLKSCDKWDFQSGRYWLVIHYATKFKQPWELEDLTDERYWEYLPK